MSSPSDSVRPSTPAFSSSSHSSEDSFSASSSSSSDGEEDLFAPSGSSIVFDARMRRQLVLRRRLARIAYTPYFRPRGRSSWPSGYRRGRRFGLFPGPFAIWPNARPRQSSPATLQDLFYDVRPMNLSMFDDDTTTEMDSTLAN